jgi:integrase
MAVKVRERPKGSGDWWIFIDHNGKRKSKKIGRNKKAANEIAKKIEAKLVLGALDLSDDGQAAKFSEYADMWITVTVPATCKRSTASDYQGLLKNHILPVFGTKPVDEINRHMVKQFLLKKVNDGYASSTVTHMKNAISGVLNLAVDDETISANPAHRIGKVFKNQKMSPLLDPLSREELSKLLKIFQRHYPDSYPLVLTLARTGMRLGEALGLQWGDIDFNGRFITIQRGITRGRVETPKNSTIRKVDMSKQLTAYLKDFKHQRKIQTLKKGWREIPEWVFINRDGKILDGPNWRKRVFNKALEKAELRKIRIHDLRHTYASQLIQRGESLAYIRDQLGHHSIKVTVDIYGHLAPEGNKAAVDGLDDDDFTQPSATLPQPNKKEG